MSGKNPPVLRCDAIAQRRARVRTWRFAQRFVVIAPPSWLCALVAKSYSRTSLKVLLDEKFDHFIAVYSAVFIDRGDRLQEPPQQRGVGMVHRAAPVGVGDRIRQVAPQPEVYLTNFTDEADAWHAPADRVADPDFDDYDGMIQIAVWRRTYRVFRWRNGNPITPGDRYRIKPR